MSRITIVVLRETRPSHLLRGRRSAFVLLENVDKTIQTQILLRFWFDDLRSFPAGQDGFLSSLLPTISFRL
jgi:hypothetical protein